MKTNSVNMRSAIRTVAGSVLAGAVLVLSAGAGEAAPSQGTHTAAPSHVSDTTW